MQEIERKEGRGMDSDGKEMKGTAFPSIRKNRGENVRHIIIKEILFEGRNRGKDGERERAIKGERDLLETVSVFLSIEAYIYTPSVILLSSSRGWDLFYFSDRERQQHDQEGRKLAIE